MDWTGLTIAIGLGGAGALLLAKMRPRGFSEPSKPGYKDFEVPPDGTRVVYWEDDVEEEGTIQGIDDQGRVIIVTDRGVEVHTYNFAEITEDYQPAAPKDDGLLRDLLEDYDR